MTSREMFQEFQVKYDKVDSQNKPEIYVEQALIFLNDAVDEVVKAARISFEETSKIVDDVSTLVKNLQIAPTKRKRSIAFKYDDTVTEDNQKQPVYYFITGYIESSIGEKFGITRIKQTKHNDIEVAKEDPFNKAQADILPIVIEDRSIITTPPSFLSLDLLIGTFFCEPKKITQTQECDLPEQLHKSIVNRAVEIALENVESPRIQTFNK